MDGQGVISAGRRYAEHSHNGAPGEGKAGEPSTNHVSGIPRFRIPFGSVSTAAAKCGKGQFLQSRCGLPRCWDKCHRLLSRRSAIRLCCNSRFFTDAQTQAVTAISLPCTATRPAPVPRRIVQVDGTSVDDVMAPAPGLDTVDPTTLVTNRELQGQSDRSAQRSESWTKKKPPHCAAVMAPAPGLDTVDPTTLVHEPRAARTLRSAQRSESWTKKKRPHYAGVMAPAPGLDTVDPTTLVHERRAARTLRPAQRSESWTKKKRPHLRGRHGSSSRTRYRRPNDAHLRTASCKDSQIRPEVRVLDKKNARIYAGVMAPAPGLEPGTRRLTAACSTD
jgi:hypothetical protein